MSITFDPTDVRLKKSNDTEPTDMAEAYLVLDEDERKKSLYPALPRYLLAYLLWRDDEDGLSDCGNDGERSALLRWHLLYAVPHAPAIK